MRVVRNLALLFACLACTGQERAPRGAEAVRKWKEDLAYFRTQVPLLHLDFFRSLPRASFDNMLTTLESRLPRMADHEVMVELARIVAAAGPRNGHTLVNLRGPAAAFHRLPIQMYEYTDGVFLRSVSQEHAVLVGARVLSIGGTPIAEALARAVEITPADNPMTKKAQTPYALMLTEVLRALRIAPGKPADPVELEVVLGDGTRNTVSLTPMASLRGVQWIDLRPAIPEKNYTYEYDEASKAMIVRYNAVQNDPEESIAAFFARVFALADEKRAEKFVLDMRENGGGDNTLNLPILHGLIRRADTIGRPGHLFVLIGRGTFSAAQNLVTQLETHTAAIFVGEPTGGSPNQFGDTVTIELPNSRLPVHLSWRFWQDSESEDLRTWLAPQLAAELSSADARSGRDPALQTALTYRPEPDVAELVQRALTNGNPDQVLASWRADPRHKWARADYALFKLAGILFATSREQALRVVELNARAYPDSRLAQYTLGTAYENLDRIAEARAAYERALAIDSKFAPVRAGLERLKRR